MNRLLPACTFAFMAISMPSVSPAQDTGFFGPDDDVTTALLLRQALGIARITEQEFNGQTRSADSRPEAFDEFDLLREAYRADPEATLSLIELILKSREVQ